MQKSTLTFPDYDSLWSFKGRSSAINVTIAPKKNMMTGLFSLNEVETAVKEFHAIQTENASAIVNTPSIKPAQTKALKPSFSFSVYKLFSLLNTGS